jgi:hypothetical protein
MDALADESRENNEHIVTHREIEILLAGEENCIGDLGEARYDAQKRRPGESGPQTVVQQVVRPF